MAVKRKRSHDDDVAPLSPWSNESTISSRTSSSSPSPLGAQACSSLPHAPVRQFDWNGNDSGRTRKRVRDARPDEAAIHESTIGKLFAAQRLFPNISPVPSPVEQPQPQSLQRSTLHSFWRLPAKMIRNPFRAVAVSVVETHKCEDCDANVTTSDMDTHESSTCSGCRRIVCDMCSVSTDCRRCLQCTAR